MELSGADAATLRLVSFGGILIAFAILERIAPRRAVTPLLIESKSKRGQIWAAFHRPLTNLGIAAIGTLVIRLLALASVPLIAVAAAQMGTVHKIGLLNLVSLPWWIEMTAALLILDLAIWAQHVASHHVKFLWRFHRVHHADRHIDVTSGIRFHPIEIALSSLFKVAVVFALGPSVTAVVLFEVVLNGCAMFNHSNLAIPRKLDQALRTILVTPDFHRVHHSTVQEEQNSNFGFNLSCWDVLFRLYRAQPSAGHGAIELGLRREQTDRPIELFWSLALPTKPLSSTHNENE